jgi:hypothetical protein
MFLEIKKSLIGYCRFGIFFYIYKRKTIGVNMANNATLERERITKHVGDAYVSDVIINEIFERVNEIKGGTDLEEVIKSHFSQLSGFENNLVITQNVAAEPEIISEIDNKEVQYERLKVDHMDINVSESKSPDHKLEISTEDDSVMKIVEVGNVGIGTGEFKTEINIKPSDVVNEQEMEDNLQDTPEDNIVSTESVKSVEKTTTKRNGRKKNS